MQKSTCIIFLCLAWLFLSGSHAKAYTTGTDYLCVDADDAADFQAALNNATGTYYQVRLSSGNYPISDVSDLHFNITVNHKLDISGGWNTDCTDQTEESPDLTILTGGTMQTGTGGGVLTVKIENNAAAAVSIHNLTIKEGSAEESGGGLYIVHTATPYNVALAVDLSLYDIVAESNETAAFGSGIAIFESGTSGGMAITFSHCIVRDNTYIASSSGGPAGIAIDTLATGAGMADTFIDSCLIMDNSAFQDGGGLYINSGTGDTTLVNNLIVGNSVEEGDGGGVYILNNALDGGDINITNNTITGNTAENQNGGGIHIDLGANDPDPENTASSINIYNNIIYDNATPAGEENGKDMNITNLHDNEVNIEYNDFNDSIPAGLLVNGDTTNVVIPDNNINDDPAFNDPATDDYSLADGSPAIDTGSNDAPSIPDYDIEGEARIQDDTVDMGAYEHPGTSGGGDSGGDSGVTGGKGCFIASAAAGISMAGDDTLKTTEKIAFMPSKLKLAAGFACMLLGIFLVGGLKKSKR